MSDHPPGDLLVAFARAELGEHAAVHVAHHVDHCPRCANVVREADPLSRVLAALPEPELPADLVARVQAATLQRAAPATTDTDLRVVAVLLLLATALAAWADGLGTWSTRWVVVRDLGADALAGLVDHPWFVTAVVGWACVGLLGWAAGRASPALLGSPR